MPSGDLVQPGNDTGAEAARVFESHRPKLRGLAYRLLGRMGEADEVVQDAFLRWFAADRSEIRDPYAFLVTTVTRLALDALKSARARREHYVGSWLPEPVMADDGAIGPLDSLEQRDLVSVGLLRLLERLSPAERAVFVLREAFDLDYEEIAPILGLEIANLRQLHARARKHLVERTRFHATEDQHLRLLTSFHAAARAGDVDALRAMLSDGVVAYGDGGGKVRASINPVVGADRVARLFVGLAKRNPGGFEGSEMVSINGRPGLALDLGGARHFVSFDFEGDRITNIYDVANPEKTARFEEDLADKKRG